MKRLSWLSLIPLMAFWLYSIGIYSDSVAFIPAIIAILAAIMIGAIAFLDTEIGIYWQISLALVPLIPSCFFIPSPYNAGLVLASLALIPYLFLPRLKSLSLGMLLCGFILSTQALALSIYYLVAPTFHSAGWLTPLFSSGVEMSGLEATSRDGSLIVYGLGQTFPFAVTSEKLGIYPWILIIAGGAVLILFTFKNKFFISMIGLISISAIYLILRFLVLINLFFAQDIPQFAIQRLDIFIEPAWLLLSFFPLVLIFCILFPPSDFKLDFNFNITKRLLLALMLIMVSSFFLIGALTFQDIGIEKSGRILVDEIHSIWEFSTLKFDKGWYGENSTYNAYCLIEWLKDSYNVDRVVGPSFKNWTVPGAEKVEPDLISDKISYEILKNYDVLIIKTPSRFDPKEVEAIVKFVKGGGGLFLIGDHTNFAGTGANLNQIAKRFGIEFGFDAVNSESGRLYSYKRGELSHLCAKYMPYLDFMTGCSIKAPLSVQPIILGFGLSAIPGDYASTGFFRETRPNDPTQITDTTWGLIYQAVALKCGKGRVVAFSDSTIISNFRAFFGGTPNFIMGSVEFLNHKDRFEYTRVLFLLIGLLIGGLGVFFMRREHILMEKRIATFLIVMALCALSTSSALVFFSVDVQDSIPNNYYGKNHTICFDAAHSTTIVGSGEQMGDYDTFFIITQRAGLVPSIDTNMKDSFGRGNIMVIADPDMILGEADVMSIHDYIKRGNSVLLLINNTASASDLIRSFNMSAYFTGQTSLTINAFNATDFNAQALPLKPNGLSIKGGHPLVSVGDRVVLAETSLGKGKFLLFTDSDLFKNGYSGMPGYMGYPNSNPSDSVNINIGYNLMALYNLEYYILDYLARAQHYGQ